VSGVLLPCHPLLQLFEESWENGTYVNETLWVSSGVTGIVPDEDEGGGLDLAEQRIPNLRVTVRFIFA
jgi:hypothetical protein